MELELLEWTRDVGERLVVEYELNGVNGVNK